MSRREPSDDQTPAPRRDVQWWLGWLAAALVVVILVMVALIAWDAYSQQSLGTDVVRMTPIVGGMSLSTATPVPVAAQPAVANAELPDDSGPITATAVVDAGPPVTAALTSTEVPKASALEIPVTTEPTATEEPTATVQPTAPEPTATPTVLPTATRIPATPTATQAPAAYVVYVAGDEVASRSGRLSLHASASMDAQVLESYSEGVKLTVLEPSGDYTTYPVIADGHGWVRVRALDGLVGWVVTDELERQP